MGNYNFITDFLFHMVARNYIKCYNNLYANLDNEETALMKRKIKDFFIMLWDYICFPFLWFSTRKIDKKLTQIAAEDRATLLTEKDVEFLKSIGVETDLEILRNKCKNKKRQNKKFVIFRRKGY